LVVTTQEELIRLPDDSKAIFANSEVRSRLLEQMPWSKKGNSVGELASCSASAVIPLTRQPIFSAGLTVVLMPGHVVPERPKKLGTATKRREAVNGQRHNVNPKL
jgi:hypothetical protein